MSRISCQVLFFVKQTLNVYQYLLYVNTLMFLQVKNIHKTLDSATINDLDRQIRILANCRGERECTVTAGRRPDMVS